MRIVFLIIVISLLAGCARPVGDFGRARPTATHDVILPAVGKLRAETAREPVSYFNLTDQETEMHDRVWRFLISPHSHDWFYDIATEWQRTRIISPQDTRFKTSRYYSYLRRQKYASSTVRYTRVAGDVDADVRTMPLVFSSICAVIEIDRQRETVANALAISDVNQQTQLDGRRGENQMYIAWFVRAAQYRYDAYTFALEHLLVETPHEQARLVDARLSELAVLTERAERHGFCEEESVNASMINSAVAKLRMTKASPPPEPTYPK